MFVVRHLTHAARLIVQTLVDALNVCGCWPGGQAKSRAHLRLNFVVGSIRKLTKEKLFQNVQRLFYEILEDVLVRLVCDET